MSARFRIVHYLADLRLGTRLPIGAFVDVDGSVTAVLAPAAPSAQCLGDTQKALLVEFLRTQLNAATSFDELPRTMIPHAFLDVPPAIPASVAHPVRWVENLFAPPPRTMATGAPATPRRATRGAAALANLQVEHVEKQRHAVLSAVRDHVRVAQVRDLANASDLAALRRATAEFAASQPLGQLTH